MPVAVALAQDRQGTLLRIKIIQVERGHFTGPGARVVKQVQDRIIPVTNVLAAEDNCQKCLTIRLALSRPLLI